MVSELQVSVKDSERKLTKKFLEYDVFTWNRNDPLLKARIDESINEFQGDKEDVEVRLKATMVIK